jgi:glycosyltransferase involved in cell wall biosynthesis
MVFILLLPVRVRARIDLSEYSDLPSEGVFKRKFGIPDEKKIILYLGRIHKTKGIDFLVEACAQLAKNMKFGDAMLVIAGPDDGYLSEAKSLARFAGLADNVLFTGLLEGHDKKCVLVDSSFVVYPSSTEPFGLVALEAAASAKPVIVSNNTPMAEIIRKGRFGFSVKYGDVIELAENMHKMLNNDSLLKEIGREGRKFIFENYDLANIVTTLEKVYEEVLSCSS